MKDKVFLGGSFPIIAGIILMLLPFSLFWETADVICDIIGFALMIIGLLMLDKEVHGFKTAAGFAALSAILSVIVLIFELGHLFAILPMVSYCFVLYFMCRRFSVVADRIGEHHMAHIRRRKSRSQAAEDHFGGAGCKFSRGFIGHIGMDLQLS